MQVGILVCQTFALDFSPDHEGIHRPADSLFTGFLLVSSRLFAADVATRRSDTIADFSRRVGHHQASRLIPTHLLATNKGMMLAQIT